MELSVDRRMVGGVAFVCGVAVAVVLVATWRRIDERRAWAEYARLTRWHQVGTEAPTNAAVVDLADWVSL